MPVINDDDAFHCPLLAEKYNQTSNTWEKIPDMLSQRSNCATAVLDGMLMTMGGFNGE